MTRIPPGLVCGARSLNPSLRIYMKSPMTNFVYMCIMCVHRTPMSAYYDTDSISILRAFLPQERCFDYVDGEFR